VGVRIPIELTAKIDFWASSNEISRSEAIRQLIEQALLGKPRRRR